MTIKDIDFVRERIEAIVAEMPDRTNPRTSDTGYVSSCVYTGDDGSHCVIGEFLARHDPEVLPGADSWLNAQSVVELLCTSRSTWGYTVEAVDWMDLVQHEADQRGATWGSALAMVRKAEGLDAEGS